MKTKLLIIKAQNIFREIVRSKVFIYGCILIIIGLVITTFTRKDKNTADVDYYYNDVIDKRNTEEEFTNETGITIKEADRNAKTLKYFFQALITSKKIDMPGISEDYVDVKDYEISIEDIVKKDEYYYVDTVVFISNNNNDLLEYIPYRRYEIKVLSTNFGLRVESLESKKLDILYR